MPTGTLYSQYLPRQLPQSLFRFISNTQTHNNGEEFFKHYVIYSIFVYFDSLRRLAQLYERGMYGRIGHKYYPHSKRKKNQMSTW